jgi:LAO/AO transport system kinase
LVDGAVAGDRGAIARLISLVEAGGEDAVAAVARLYPQTGRAYTVGITGAPGAGKSTLTDRLVRYWRRAGDEVGVLAVDPSSPFSGGAILGDRVRMQDHALDPGVFIRSMATRGHLGGMALAAPEAIRILDASGKDLVIVETVGVGQAEVEIASAADTTLVVVAPGWGDAVQVSKAGILEIADVFVVNKADRDGADDAVRELNQMLRTGARGEWTPPVVRTSVTTGQGIDDLWEAIERHRTFGESSGSLEAKRRRRVLAEVQEMVAARLRADVGSMLAAGAERELANDLMQRRVDPYRAAAVLLERVRANGSSGGSA